MGTTTNDCPTVGLRPPRHRFDARVVRWWRVRLVLVTTALVAPLTVLGVLIAPARAWLLWPALTLALLGGVAVAVLPASWYRVNRWEVADHAVYTRTGYLLATWRIAPISRIQTVDTTRGPLQHHFGLATVVVTTASAAGAVRIAGLPHRQAAELADHLSRRTHETPGDAT